MSCMKANEQQNSACRVESKEYFDCRMNNNLMTKEEWSKLGYDDLQTATTYTEESPPGSKG